MENEIVKRDSHITDLQKKNKAIEKQNEKLKQSMQHTSEESLNEQAENSRLQDELRACKERLVHNSVINILALSLLQSTELN